MTTASDKSFTGAIPEIYESHLVPLIFAPYARDLATRVASVAPTGVLEIAAGTGVVTRALAGALPATTSIMATDLNEAMLAQAAAIGTCRPVEWRQCNAMALPFADRSFDAVVCQFGAMFFPDRVKAYAEARRVLRSGGTFWLSVWDRIEDNEFADEVTAALAALFPQDPPRFLARTPHGYHDRSRIRRDLADAGFDAAPQIDTVTARSPAASANIAAVAYCEGTPLRNEIEARAPGGLAAATKAATARIAARFGDATVDGRIQAHVVTVQA
jgi:ubiquinone/menaquinone biosynthesis C-methylase UbiE